MFTLLNIAPVFDPAASVFGVETKFHPGFSTILLGSTGGGVGVLVAVI